MAGVNCGKLDLTKLPQDEIITINKQTWLKADVDEKIYIIQNKPHVVIKSVNKFDDYVKVEYSVFVEDKRGVTPHMENITCTIHMENLLPYMRDNKLNELGI